MCGAYVAGNIADTIYPSGLCRAISDGCRAQSEDSDQSANAVNVSRDIVFPTLQAVEEAEQLISGLITRRPAIGRRRLDLGRLDRLMSEPQCNHRTIDARL